MIRFDPLGIRCIVYRLKGVAPKQVPFTIKGPYRWVRHPLYFFSILMIWSCPVVSLDRLIFNLAWTVWIAVGALFEERDLVTEFGEVYIEYQRDVPMLLPVKWNS